MMKNLNIWWEIKIFDGYELWKIKPWRKKMAQDWDHLLLWHHDVNAKIVKIVGVGMVTHETQTAQPLSRVWGYRRSCTLAIFLYLELFPKDLIRYHGRKGLGWYDNSIVVRIEICTAELEDALETTFGDLQCWQSVTADEIRG